MKNMLDADFHNTSILAQNVRFDYVSLSNKPFDFMESNETSSEWLNFHHLRYFHAVACTGSIRLAAERLRTSQSALCSQVKQLEAALGEPLYLRSGRSIALTEFGRMVQAHADEIFTLGGEILSLAKRGPTKRALRLNIGIVDSFPKLLSLDVLRPVFNSTPPIQVSCHEGKLEDLVGQLVAHRLDALLADELPPSTVKAKTFDHPLGESGITFCAEPRLARKLTGRFPRMLHGAPLLLPMPHTPLRRDLERWFHAARLSPVIVGEYEDAALAKIIATEGVGVIAVPTLVGAEAVERYGFVALGRTEACRVQLHLITAERRIQHPAIALLAEGRVDSKPRRLGR